MSQLSLGALGGIVLSPEALKEQRGAWCSPPEITAAVGEFDADPFTNPRSTLRARWLCMLERGDDGFGLARRNVPGTIYIWPGKCDDVGCGECGYITLTAEHRVWIQPPYDIVPEALAHFGHTRFVALLRLDTSTGWFETLHGLCETIMVPKRERLEFVPPPGVVASTNPFPHGLFYKRAADVTPAIRELCYEWPIATRLWPARRAV